MPHAQRAKPRSFLPVASTVLANTLQNIFTVGDLHGDLDKAVEALKLAQVITVSEEGEVAWVGGDTVVVQLGDVLDRGDVEIGERLAT